jgi:hypothetical protein
MSASRAVTEVTETTIGAASPANAPHGAAALGGAVIETSVRTIESAIAIERTVKAVAANALDASNAALMGDAPACDGCGSITVRNGTCYRCLNCGNSMGCS